MSVGEEIIQSAEGLSNHIQFKKDGIYTIKLRSLLELAQVKNVPPDYKTQLPPIGLGSITLVDQILMILMVKLARPKNILEIGTFQGFTTRLLLENVHNDCKIYSIDLPQDSSLINHSSDDEKQARMSEGYNDDYLKRLQMSTGEIYLKDITNADREKLILIKEDSNHIDFSKNFKDIELVFIDGGHDRKTVYNDSKNSLNLVKNGLIIWHDYQSDIHREVTSYIELESVDRPFFFVNNSLSCFTVCGSAKEFFVI